ncbi:MAG: ABC transporter ATP-binding protein, partial [Deltaproteobacteria bacterium]|nr:ABC transporter ATP-binding protein [Deltaproteobacteria bacterium]
MSTPIIQVSNISKIFRIGARERKNRTFREALVDAIAAPIRNLGELRRLTRFDKRHLNGSGDRDPSELDYIWALKDVSFEVQEGEV